MKQALEAMLPRLCVEKRRRKEERRRLRRLWKEMKGSRYRRVRR